MAASILLLAPASGRAQTRTLPELCRAVLAHAEEGREAEARAEAAQARSKQARGRLLPRVAAEAGAVAWPSASSVELPEVVYTRPSRRAYATIGFEQPLFDDGVRLRGWRSLRFEAEAARLERRCVREDLLYETAGLFFDLLEAGEAERNARASMERRSAHLDAVRRGIEAGTATEVDLARAEAESKAAEADRLQAEDAAAAASRRLAALTGLEVSSAAPPAPLDPPPLPDDVASNPLALAAKASADAADEALGAARGARVPELSIGGRYWHVEESPESILYVRDEAFGFAALRWDAFTGGSKSAAAQAAGAAKEERAQAYARLLRDLDTQAATARDALRRAEALLAAQTARAAAARDAYEKTRTRWEAGADSALARQDAEAELTAAEVAAARARYARERAVLSLYAAAGRLEPALLP